MKIADLEKNSKVENLVAVITQLDDEIKDVGSSRAQEGVLSDESDQVKLTLWDGQIEKFNVGDKVLIKSGWCKEFPTDSGELQISTGKFGKIQMVPPERV